MKLLRKHTTLTASMLAVALILSACGGGDAESPPTRAAAAPVPDTTPPTVFVTDNEESASASGPVTFTFSFSEDVGSSFTADDITVTGGVKGTFEMTSGRLAQLVVAPPAGVTSGNLTVSVAAGAFSDAAGNLNTTAVNASQAFGEAPVGTDSVLATFDEATPPPVQEFGGAGYAIEVGPAGGNGNSLKITRPGGEVFAGAFVTLAPIAFEAGRTTITARVYSPTAGIPMVAKVEYADNQGTGETNPTTAVVVGWQTLTWVFNNVDLTKSYTRFVILPNLGTVGTGQSYFFDDITLAPKVVTPPTTGTAFLSFDEVPQAYADLGSYGGALPSVEAAPAGGSANALKIVKPVSPDTWGGAFFTLAAKVPFTADKKSISARVRSTRAGAVYTLKVQVTETDFVEVAAAPAGAADTWSTVTWDFSAASLSKNYTVIAITPDVTLVTTGQTYYIDDLTVVAGSTTPPPTGTTFLSFDEVPEAFSDLGAYGGALPTVEAGPAPATGNALKILKPVSPDTWGGAFFTLAAKVPFTADRKSISARVRSTRAGAVYALKVEVSETDFVEVTSAPAGPANTWSTVTWDFSAASLTKNYRVMAITPDVTLATTGQSYFIDEMTVVAGSTTPPPTAGSTLATFDETPPLVFSGFGGAEPNTTVEPGPTGGTGNALKLVRSGGDVFAGAVVTTGRIGFTSDRKTITLRMHSSKAGVPMWIKAEGANGLQTPDARSTTPVVTGWQTLTFVLNADITRTYDKITLLPDLGTVGTGETYFFDDIQLLEAGQGPVVQAVTIATLDEPGASLAGFEGAWDSTIVNDPKGGTNKVGRVVKPGDAGSSAGSTIVTVANGGLPKIMFTASAQTMTVFVWSPDANIPVRLKVEDIADGSKSVETETRTTVANAWQTLTFNFANPVAGTPALNLANTYNKVTIFFDFGTNGTGKTYYFDDIVFVTGTGTNQVLATFGEATPPYLLGFGGAENSSIIGVSGGLPVGTVGRAVRVVKALGAEVFAGTSVQAKRNDAVPTIPFVNGATKMTLRVLSAYPGMRVHMKVENASDPGINSEVDAFTTRANEWETLTFDFGPDGIHLLPSGPGPTDYNPNLPTAQLDVNKIYNKVSVFFDFGLGGGGYDGMPDTRTYYFDDLRYIGR
jgi:hypothetical protein